MDKNISYTQEIKLNSQMEQLQQLKTPLTFYPLKDFPNYLISKEGIVLSLITNRLMKQHVQQSGYYAVSIKTDTSNFQFVHRLLATTFIPNPDNLPEVNHIDGNKLNNSLDNLEWVTGCANIRHAFTHDLCVNGAAVDYSELDIIVNRLLTEPDSTWSSLAREMEVSDPSTLRKLVKRDLERRGMTGTWEHLTDVVNEKGIAVSSNKVIVTTPKGEVYEFRSQAKAADWLGMSHASVCRSIRKGVPCGGCTITYVKANQ